MGQICQELFFEIIIVAQICVNTQTVGTYHCSKNLPSDLSRQACALPYILSNLERILIIVIFIGCWWPKREHHGG